MRTIVPPVARVRTYRAETEKEEKENIGKKKKKQERFERK